MRTNDLEQRLARALAQSFSEHIHAWGQSFGADCATVSSIVIARLIAAGSEAWGEEWLEATLEGAQNFSEYLHKAIAEEN